MQLRPEVSNRAIGRALKAAEKRGRGKKEKRPKRTVLANRD
jgi:hypothetical protein